MVQKFALYWLSWYAVGIVERMARYGYYYDENGSYKGSIRFTLDNGGSTFFGSWREARYFLIHAFG